MQINKATLQFKAKMVKALCILAKYKLALKFPAPPPPPPPNFTQFDLLVPHVPKAVHLVFLLKRLNPPAI